MRAYVRAFGWVVALNTGCIFWAVMNTNSSVGFFLVCWLVRNQNVVQVRAQEEFCITLNPLSRTALCRSLSTDQKTSRAALRLPGSLLSPLFLLCSCLRFSSGVRACVRACVRAWGCTVLHGPSLSQGCTTVRLIGAITAVLGMRACSPLVVRAPRHGRYTGGDELGSPVPLPMWRQPPPSTGASPLRFGGTRANAGPRDVFPIPCGAALLLLRKGGIQLRWFHPLGEPNRSAQCNAVLYVLRPSDVVLFK